MFNELSAMFPAHTSFFQVVGFPIEQAIEKCATLTLENGHVINYNGQIIFAVTHELDCQIDWLIPITDPNASVSSSDASA